MPNIKSIKAKEVPSSKGVSTVEVELKTKEGIVRASVPSGVSTGKYEAQEIEAEKAVENIERIIAPRLKLKEISSQEEFDGILLDIDSTGDKSRLGANALLPVSVAFLRASGLEEKAPLWQLISRLSGQMFSLPKPLLLVSEGGKHGKSGLALQEFMVVSQIAGFKENFSQSCQVYLALQKVLEEKFGKKGVLTGYEGGFVPPVEKTTEMLDLILKAIDKSRLAGQIQIALDAAASEFFQNGRYYFEGRQLAADELAEIYSELLKKYPILSIEDPFTEDDIASWQNINSKLKTQNSKILIIADDLTVTNPQRMKMAQEQGLCQGVIIKPNQIGTVSETIEAAKLARQFGWKIIVSHRAGDTSDDFIADLAVGLGADFIKTGGPFKPERKAKYDRLLEIEKEL